MARLKGKPKRTIMYTRDDPEGTCEREMECPLFADYSYSRAVASVLYNDYVWLLLLCSIVCGAVFFKLVYINNADYTTGYYAVGKALLSGTDISDLYGPLQGYKNLPIVGMAFIPFAILGETLGWKGFLIVELLSYFTAFFLFLRFLSESPKDKLVVLVLFLFSNPFYTSIMLGQTTPFTFLCLVSMLLLNRAEKPKLAGVFLCFAFLIKIPVGLFSPYFLVKKNYRLFFSFVSTYMVFLASSLLIFGIDANISYFKDIILGNSRSVVLALNNQNILASIMRFVDGSHVCPYDWAPAQIQPVLYYSINMLILGLLVYTFRIFRNRDQDQTTKDIEASMVICVSLMIFPIAWDHYYLFLIFPFYALYRSFPEHIMKPSYILAFLFCNLSLFPVIFTLKSFRIRETAEITRTINNYVFFGLVSLPFIGCTILLGLLIMARKKLPLKSSVATCGDSA